jgi:hypothetical protein
MKKWLLIFVLLLAVLLIQAAETNAATFEGEDGKPFQLQPSSDEGMPDNTLTKGDVTLTDDVSGKVIAEGKIKIVEAWGCINIIQGATFSCTPTADPVDFGKISPKGTPTYATLEFIPPDRWKAMDTNLYIISELVQTGPLTTQNILSGGPIQPSFNLEKSITRASIIALPKGKHIIFGYKIAVTEPTGLVTFRLGKIVAHKNCQILSGQ